METGPPYDYLVYCIGTKLFRDCVSAAEAMIKQDKYLEVFFLESEGHAYIVPINTHDDELMSGPPMFAVIKGFKQLHPVIVFPPLTAKEVRSRGRNITSVISNTPDG